MNLQGMSDADLEAMIAGGQPAAPSFGGMSDAELEAIAGGAPADAGLQRTLGEDYAHKMGVGYRGSIQHGLEGVTSIATLPMDAMVNAAYGVKKLASKTGLVDAPDPKNYYGKSDSYLPTTSGVSEGVGELLDKTGLPRADTTTERMTDAVAGGALSAVSGAGIGNVVARGGSALAQRVGGFLADQPGIQAAAGAASGGAAQGTAEIGGDGTAQTVAGLVAGGATGLAGARAARPARAAVPTTEALRDAKTAAYAAKDAAGITVTPADAQRFAATMRRDLPNEGVFPQHDPHAAGVLAGVDRLGAPDAMGVRQPVSLAEIEKVRQNAGLLQKNPDPAARRTGSVLTGQLDDFVDAIPGAGPLSDEARAANRRYAKASALDTALDKATLRAKSNGTGANLENAQRQNLRQIIQDPNSRAFRQFDPAEREAMRSIVEGSPLQNTLRYAGKFAPTGPVSGLFGMGAALSGNIALPIAGLAAKGAADYLHGRKVRRLEDLVKGGPGAGRRPSSRYGANAARGAAQGFLAGGRYR